MTFEVDGADVDEEIVLLTTTGELSGEPMSIALLLPIGDNEILVVTGKDGDIDDDGDKDGDDECDFAKQGVKFNLSREVDGKLIASEIFSIVTVSVRSEIAVSKWRRANAADGDWIV